jgi:Bifunctional DNA primase/polymerase, N-terminal
MQSKDKGAAAPTATMPARSASTAVSTEQGQAVDPKQFFAIALPMAERGVPIIPVQPQQKKCTLPGWQNVATNNAQQLMAWQVENPHYNTGCMASYAAGVCVLDCDVMGLLKRIEQETGKTMPATFLVRSAGRGTAHVYFKHSERSRKMGNRKAAGVFDFKADRSYVVGPGSVLLKDGELREYTIYRDVPFAEIPDWLCAWIEKNADAEKARPQACAVTHPDFDIYSLLDWYGLGFEEDGNWFVTDVCPVAGRKHEQSTATGFYFDGQHFGFHCFAGNCTGSEMTIGQVIKHLNKGDGKILRAPYSGPIWSELPALDVKIKGTTPQPAAEPEPAPIVPDGFDFISEYVHCNDRYEAPAKLHEVIAISTLSAIANSNGVTFPYADRQHPMDLWLAALLRSGAGKNESLNVMRALLGSLTSYRDLFNSTRWGSPEFFYQAVAERTAQFWTFTELSEFLGKLTSSRWAEVKPWLTDRFDSSTVPAAIKHRTNAKGETTTPNIEFLTAPRINVLGMSNADWYLEKLRESDIRGGFLARFVPIAMAPSGRAVHFVQAPDAELWQTLTEKLLAITRVRGAADLSAVLSPDPGCPYGRWYAETQRRWARGNGELADVLFARWRVFVLKLAVVFELSASGSLGVTEASFDRAARWLREQEATLFSVAEVGGKRGLRLRRKLQFFEAAGTNGVRHSAHITGSTSTSTRASAQMIWTR